MRRIVPLSLLPVSLVVAACHKSGGSSNNILATGDTAIVESHLSQQKIELGQTDVATCLEQGKKLFAANFNELDGQGRPETTGTGVARNRRVEPQNFNRISSPEANSCAGCHNIPRIGGGGDNVANVFVLGQRFEFVNFDGGVGDGNAAHTLQNVANERNTLGMFGSGFVELLAREITTDLQSIKADAIVQAQQIAGNVTLSLDSKGINYGSITAHLDGSVDTSAVVGVDADLVIRPFHQKGVVVSLREFTNNALNHHHGMQSEERFGTNVDSDQDGLVNEVSKGDVTAMVLFQATLPAPGRVYPGATGAEATAVAAGETLFGTLGCAICHVPELVLNDPIFSEPNPFNPVGNLRPADVATSVDVDLTTAGPGPHLPKESDGTVKIHAYTDLKRHDMGVGLAEPLVQAGVPGNLFITRKLWGTYNEPPYMHHGRATTLKEAILMHGGEAKTAHDNFAALTNADQDRVIAFLKTLQVLPEDATTNEIIGQPTGFVGDVPQLGGGHIAQGDVDNGVYTPEALSSIGKTIFNAKFNTLDGQGRPTTTGTGVPRTSHVAPENFNRISAPDSNSCAGCHNTPRSGGGGDNVTNVFVLGQRFSFVRFDGVSADDAPAGTHLDSVADERNTLGMFGSGFVELLAREMTVDLQAIRTNAIAQAVAAEHDVTLSLDSKGVNFGSITAHSGSSVDTTAVVGINTDLILRPFHQKGVVVSIREFTNNAENHHHGMQSDERFDPTGANLDPDGDGVLHELTRGDVTATVIYQAMLPVSGRKMPTNAKKVASVHRGETLFAQIGCTVCHVPTLTLNNPVFSEPNPFNPNSAGPPPNKNMQVSDVPHTFDVDLTAHGIGPRLPKESNGTVLVPAFTDLKRHDMGAALNNEKVVQGGVPTSSFITKKLWGFYSEPPFMHDSRSLTVKDAILRHGGEAAAAEASFAALSARDQLCVVDFLKTLQTLPEGSPLVISSDD